MFVFYFRQLAAKKRLLFPKSQFLSSVAEYPYSVLRTLCGVFRHTQDPDIQADGRVSMYYTLYACKFLTLWQLSSDRFPSPA